ncbi:histidinol-phosphate transaminase [Acetobacterium paludosum]|uniref:Histidinol-phosphate aminotransferase n=1 Tax=Acetobacterium paludosum TaxID=52693 RepID=A0A923I250_9FIRM|nr:histidinol-phosphate transaminase [Acetobacterium paludosum]MBC3887700.1 histidinol-phosphate transaminase [Acetobacterium paludosum]
MESLIRKNIQDLVAYKVDAPQYEIIVNANESPYDFPMILKRQFTDDICNTDLNRYPEACFPELLNELSAYTGVPTDGIICGSGSDELIAMINQAFVNAGDVVVSHSPSFDMYNIWAKISDSKHIRILDLPGHIPDVDGIIKAACDNHAKLLYICNPNNPTGYTFAKKDIIKILDAVPSLVVLDEAYIEFFGESDVDLLPNYPRLLILRTLSKAFGLAGIRCGYALGNKNIIDVLYKVKAPYNLNVLTQKMAVIALQNRDKVFKNLEEIKAEREKAMAVLKELPSLTVYPSGANFIYFETPFAEKIYEVLLNRSILIKRFKETGSCPESIRFSIGKPKENQKILEIIKEVVYNEA